MTRHRRTLSAADGTAAQRYLLDHVHVHAVSALNGSSDDTTATATSNNNTNNNVSFQNGQWNDLSSMKMEEDRRLEKEGECHSASLRNSSHTKFPPRGTSSRGASRLTNHHNRNLSLSNANDVLSAAADMLKDDLDGFMCLNHPSSSSSSSLLKKTVSPVNQQQSFPFSSTKVSIGTIDELPPPTPSLAHVDVVNKLEKLENSVVDLSQSLMDWRGHFDKSLGKVMTVIQSETSRRAALESRLHAQLLLQNENMIAMEMKLLRLEAKAAASTLQSSQRGVSRGNTNAQQQNSMINNSRNSGNNGHVMNMNSNPVAIEDGCESLESSTATPSIFSSSRPIRTAIMSSTTSLASGVTADEGLQEGDTSHREGDDDHTEEDDRADADDGSVGDNDSEVDGYNSTGSFMRNRMTLDTMLQNDPENAIHHPVSLDSGVSFSGLSTRATRGLPSLDGASSLGTNLSTATGLTAPETVNSNTTTSVMNSRSINDDEATLRSNGTATSRNREAVNRSANLDSILGLLPPPPRSRSQSPMTLPSVATSIGTSTAAVAPSRTQGNNRRVAAVVHATNESHDQENESELGGKSERAVSFVDTAVESFFANDSAYGGDSLTMPDEIDTFSDAAGVVESFVNSSRAWREEYEARLDAIQNKFSEET